MTHIKGHGGVTGTVKGLVKQIGDFRFNGLLRYRSYYDSDPALHAPGPADNAGVEESLRDLVRQYLEAPDLHRPSRCMIAGGALFPPSMCCHWIYLLPLDDAMQRPVAKSGIYHARYVADLVILAKTQRFVTRARLFVSKEPAIAGSGASHTVHAG